MILNIFVLNSSMIQFNLNRSQMASPGAFRTRLRSQSRSSSTIQWRNDVTIHAGDNGRVYVIYYASGLVSISHRGFAIVHSRFSPFKGGLTELISIFIAFVVLFLMIRFFVVSFFNLYPPVLCCRQIYHSTSISRCLSLGSYILS